MEATDENVNVNPVNEKESKRNYVVLRNKGKTEIKNNDLEFNQANVILSDRLMLREIKGVPKIKDSFMIID